MFIPYRRFFLLSFLLTICSSFCLFFRSKFIKIDYDFFSMGTYGKIKMFIRDYSSIKHILYKISKRVEFIELNLTKFDTFSDLSIVNNNVNFYTTVSDDLYFVLYFSCIIHDMTYGYFDIGIGNFLSEQFLDNTVPVVGNSTELDDISLNIVSFRNEKVMLNRLNTMLDLGGIGKGFAIDEISFVLMSCKVHHFVIEFGGDIKAFGGMPDNRPWEIVMDNRLSFLFSEYLNTVFYLYSGSVASSGGYIKNSSICSHIIDPVGFASDKNYYLIVVFGSSSMICDALATACYNMDYYTLLKVKRNFIGYNIKSFLRSI